MNDEHFDARERATRAREAALMAALPGTGGARAGPHRRLRRAAGRRGRGGVTSRAALARCPCAQDELLERQQAQRQPRRIRSAASRPSAGAAWRGAAQRVFQSPGPIYEPGARPDYWRMARAMHAAGFLPAT